MLTFYLSTLNVPFTFYFAARTGIMNHYRIHARFWPPKAACQQAFEVKMKSNPNENYIGLKFSPICPLTANFIQIGQLLYK